MALLALSILLSACAGTTPPVLRVTQASLKERSTEAAVVVFTLEATNPNTEALPLTRVEYQLSLEGRVLARGLRSAEATIRRHGQSRITVPISVPIEAAQQGALAYRLEGRLGYLPFNATSRMLVDAGLRFPSVAFADEGTIVLTAAEAAP